MQFLALAVALLLGVANAAVTTTTHDSSKWWPHWAWWLLALGLLCLIGACVAGLLPFCMKKKAPKTRAVKKAAPAPATTTYTTAPVMTMAAPVTTAQPVSYAMAAPSFTTVAAPTYAVEQQYAVTAPQYTTNLHIRGRKELSVTAKQQQE